MILYFESKLLNSHIATLNFRINSADTLEMHKCSLLFLFSFLIHFPLWGASGDLPQGLTLEGQLYDTPTGTDPFLGQAEIEIHILSPDKNCVLYAEKQTIDTTFTEGIFNIQVGSITGSAKRVATVDPGNSMATVYQNRAEIPATGASCPGVTSFTPAGTEGRYVRISVTPTASGLTDVLGPDMYLGSVPTALVAETLQGLLPSSFLRLATVSNLTQANLEDVFSNTNYPILQDLLASGGTSTSSTANAVVNADNDANGSGAVLFQINGSTKAEIKNDGDFAVGSNLLYVDAATQKVGIGSALPAFDLSFGGSAAKTMGIERNPSSGAGGSLLTVKSGGAATGDTNMVGGDLLLSSGVSTGTGTSNIYLQTASAGASGTADNNPTTKMTILGNGNVGIGTTTPSEKLEVGGNVKLNLSNSKITGNTGLTLEATGDTFGTVRLNMQNRNGVNGAMFEQAGSVDLVDFVFKGLNNQRNIRYENRASLVFVAAPEFQIGTAGNPTLVVSDSSSSFRRGNVGIGTATPGTNLSISSSTASNGSGIFVDNTNASGYGVVRVNSGNAHVAVGAALHSFGSSYGGVGAYAPSTTTLSGFDSGGLSVHANNASGALKFYTGGSAATNERMRIDSTGYVGIGLTGPTAKLHTYQAGAAGTVIAKFQNDAATCSITDAGMSCASDERLKTDIQPISNGLEKVLFLNGVTYRWKKGDSKERQMGFIAQEVEKVAPELVRDDKDLGHKQVNYSNFVALLTQAVKQLYGQFTAIYKRVDNSEQKIAVHDKQFELQSKDIASIKEQMKVYRVPASIKQQNRELRSEISNLKAENELMKSYFCKKDPSAPFCK